MIVIVSLGNLYHGPGTMLSTYMMLLIANILNSHYLSDSVLNTFSSQQTNSNTVSDPILALHNHFTYVLVDIFHDDVLQ